eukprot:529557-Prymnesium_polylepis.1
MGNAAAVRACRRMVRSVNLNIIISVNLNIIIGVASSCASRCGSGFLLCRRVARLQLTESGRAIVGANVL